MRKVVAKKPAPTKRKSAPRQSPARAASTEVKITAAKGRPMLTWVGKAPLRQVTAFPAQYIETFGPGSPSAALRVNSGVSPARDQGWQNWPSTYPKGGLLFHGDNKDVLAHLLASGFRGKVDLIYIDPPFDSGADYVRKVNLRGASGSTKLEGESYTLGEQIQYTDIWANDNYLQFMYERLLLLRELLAEDGSIWLHCDWNKNHQLRAILDEVFGPASIVNEVIWQRISAHPDSTYFGHIHDTLFFYAKDPNSVAFHTPYARYPKEFIERYFTRDDGDGRGSYWTGDITAPGPRPGLDYDFRGHRPPAGRVWFTLPDKMAALDEDGRVYWPQKGGRPKLKRYLNEYPGIPAASIWTDVKSLAGLGAPAAERLAYPTQKPEALLERIVAACSHPGGIVLDCFVGSGTAAAVAQKLGRRWIACDVNKGAIQTTSKRLQTVIAEQAAAASQGKLLEEEDKAAPAQLGFTVWRVNDYDLQIQHNEAVNLACEHIGIERTRSDSFFEGTLGNRLVKIIPFGHPLSPVDLEEIKRELDARPEEDRNVVAVCLGKEFAADKWLEDWNRLRRGKGAVNRIEAIELRTDPKYGKFFAHQPAKAKVKIGRKHVVSKAEPKDRITVEIMDFISPTILERLQQQAGLVKPTIEDWRAMVDCVMIDPAYNGEVFNIALSDVPEKKSDLVRGKYDLPAPRGETTVAVKIVDMLGEEVLVTREV